MANLIVAIAENKAIGLNNALLWRIPSDLALFKRITTGKTVIMGRKTYESIGRSLPNRRNIVLSRNMEPQPGIEVCRNLDEAIELVGSGRDTYIIGGGAIYEEALKRDDYIEQIYLSSIQCQIAGDTYLDLTPFLDQYTLSESHSPYKFGDQFPYVATVLVRRSSDKIGDYLSVGDFHESTSDTRLRK